MAAITADGFIGKDASHLADWSSPEDKKLFVSLTKQAGTMVMGSKTFDTIGRALPGRRTIVYTTHPEKYQGLGVVATSEDPAKLVGRLAQEGCEDLAIVGGAQIYDQFLRAGLVDELYLTIEPVLFGKGINLLANSIETGLELKDTQKLNDNTILLHYAVKN
nr:dihydrofolate reductase [uncultured bacterium]AIA11622.1 Dihydrofolate reductase [uncultured bacterium]